MDKKNQTILEVPLEEDSWARVQPLWLLPLDLLCMRRSVPIFDVATIARIAEEKLAIRKSKTWDA